MCGVAVEREAGVQEGSGVERVAGLEGGVGGVETLTHFEFTKS